MSLLAPLTAHSLGVGDIKLHSALNQKLNAEIALSLAADEDLSDIKVTLATPDKFDKLGIAWSYFLSKVKFQTVVKANGKVVIKMTSDEVVQEPFLDFLVEVSWPKGDIFKEFTVLVDPPTDYLQSRIDAPVISSSKPSSNTVNVDTKVQNNITSLAVEGEYGPTNRNDSLWRVAEKVNKDSDISVEQMMMALYKANPRAFYKKNVNALMAGKTLKIPEKANILQLSKKQANTQFYRQMAVWKGKPVSEPDVPQVIVKENTKQLTLVPPAEEEVTNSGALTANTTDQENLVTENQQLQERLANLEKQFAIMQEMMAIKNQQLAVMQNAQQSTDLQTDSIQEHEKQGVIDNAEELETQQAESEESVISADIKPTQEINTEEISKKQPVVAHPTPVAAPVHKVQQETAVRNDSGGSYYYLGLGLFGALAMGGIGWLLWRKRQTEEEINENSMFASSSEIFLPDTGTDTDEELEVPVFDEKSSYNVGSVGESSFLSEFTPSDFDVFETDQSEVDPTSETDVYLAYGRYQQAEELMRQAITDHPDKDDYKLKLLEIFYTSENREAFEEYANDLMTEGKNSDLNFWAKVSEMGGELIPDSALFSPEHTESKYTLPDEPLDSSSTDDSKEEATPQVDDVTKVADVSADSDNSGLDFDLSSLSLADDTQDEPAKSADKTIADVESDLEGVDFDLGSFEPTDSSDTKGSEESSAVDININEAVETIEFNPVETDTSKVENLDIPAEDSTLAESNNDFDFNFDDFTDVPVAEKLNGSDGQNDDLMVSDLTDMDEFETKIDLAKAYIDMGDESAAKDIVQEVLDKGNNVQKDEAQAIIDQLG